MHDESDLQLKNCPFFDSALDFRGLITQILSIQGMHSQDRSLMSVMRDRLNQNQKEAGIVQNTHPLGRKLFMQITSPKRFAEWTSIDIAITREQLDIMQDLCDIHLLFSADWSDCSPRRWHDPSSDELLFATLDFGNCLLNRR